MARKLLVTFLGLLLIIPNDGNPIQEKDDKPENIEVNPKTESASEKPSNGTSKNDDVVPSTTSKAEELPKETQTKKLAASTTPEPVVEDDEDQVYFMLPKRQKSNEVAFFNPQQPFYFNPSGFQQQQPRFMFNQPNMQMPFSYPMMFQPMVNPPHLNANNYMDFNLQRGFFDSSTMFSVPQVNRPPFGMNMDYRNNRYFIPQAHSWYGGVVDPIHSKQIANHYF